MDGIELKPCPFCGGKAEYRYMKDVPQKATAVYYRGLGIGGRVFAKICL